MAVDPVPWLTENGASHSANVARNVSFAAFAGRQGIVSPTDFAVNALLTPGTSIRVAPGTCSIINRAAGMKDEMYVARAATETQVAISATGGSPRYDMIVAQVENPWLAGEPWANPPSNANGPYFFIRVISNVPSTAKVLADVPGYSGRSAIPLARIAIPASTSTITQAMITDLRDLARPKSQRNLAIYRPVAQSPNVPHSATFTDMPNANQATFEVPTWATHFRVVASVGSFTFGNDNQPSAQQWDLAGHFRVKTTFGNGTVAYFADGVYDLSQPVGAYYQKESTIIGQEACAIPAAARGKDMIVRWQTNRTSGDAGAEIFVSGSTTFSWDIEFYDLVENNL